VSDDLEHQLRDALHRSDLPSAPAALRIRLEALDQHVTEPSRRPSPIMWALLAPLAAILLVAVSGLIVGGHAPPTAAPSSSATVTSARPPATSCAGGVWPTTTISCDTVFRMGDQAGARVDRARIWLTTLAAVRDPRKQVTQPTDAAAVWVIVYDGFWRCCPNAVDQNGNVLPQLDQTTWLVVAEAAREGTGFIYSQDWTAKPVPYLLPPPPGATASGSPIGLSSPAAAATASASPSASNADPATALAAATRFEAARASGNWPVAWALLSTYSKGLIGTISDFEREETAYNDSAGSTHRIYPPTQDPQFLSVDYLGDVYTDIAAKADISRAWLIVVQHPDMHAASAATITLVVAPIGSNWVVWIGH
jgi:hypothetical protein